MPFIDVINKVVALANDVVEKDKALHKKHGLELGLSLGDKSTTDYMKEASNLRDELNAYLNTLPDDQVAKIETVMYFGRDPEDVHGNDLPELHDRLHQGKIDKADSIRNIGEKCTNLEIYFNSAVKKAHDLSINLEDII